MADRPDSNAAEQWRIDRAARQASNSADRPDPIEALRDLLDAPPEVVRVDLLEWIREHGSAVVALRDAARPFALPFDTTLEQYDALRDALALFPAGTDSTKRGCAACEDDPEAHGLHICEEQP